jgi:hypothetical protein
VKIAIRESLHEMAHMILKTIEPPWTTVDKLWTENKQLRMQSDKLKQYGRRPIVWFSGTSEIAAKTNRPKF